MSDESRIHLLGSNGNGARGSLVQKKGFITAEQAAQIATEVAVKVTEHYMSQMPAFVSANINSALAHYGLIKLAPPPVEDHQAVDTGDAPIPDVTPQ